MTSRRHSSMLARTSAIAATFVLVASLALPRAAWPAGNPDFDAVNWIAQCGIDPPNDASPSSADLVGDATFPSTYTGQDASYIYFRYRVDKTPSGPNGFATPSWVVLLNLPVGNNNPFRYQYELALNGTGSDDQFGNTGSKKGDTIEIWANDPATAQDIDFSPSIFNDPAETPLYIQKYDFSSGSTPNTTPLARFVAASGSSFNGDGDFFVDVAYPISVLISKGVIASAADLASARYFLATSANSNNYNKDHECQFVPNTTLGITKTVAPTSIPVNGTTSVTYTIAVTNTGNTNATGVVIQDPALPAYMSSISVAVSSSTPSVSWTVVSNDPLQVKVPNMPPGASVTVQITASASPKCSDGNFNNIATAEAINAVQVSASATLTVTKNAPEICNGIDDNCDGQIDEGGSALCDNGNACDGVEACGGMNGCIPGTPVQCTASDQCHVAGVCDPSTGACSNPIKPNGSTCNDGNACTQTDTCQNGACVPGNPVVCTAQDQCHVAGVCDPSSGVCSNPTKPNGSACTDGNACTDGDTCQSGSCVPGAPQVCNPLDQCHDAGVCNPQNGVCSNPPKANGSACNDGDACTQSDTCQAGTCTGSNPVTCTAQDQCHVAGTCDPGTGTCSNPIKANGSMCSDGNACTDGDTCQNGTCTPGTPQVCNAQDQCHVAGTCDPSTGACSNPIKTNGSSCNDGNLCTQTDTCQNGTCTGSNQVTCAALDDCHQVGTCDPGTGQCTNPIEPDGTACNNPGNLCLQTHQCVAGVCTGSNPVTCPPTDQCHDAGVCNTQTGTCSNPAKPDGSTCNDGNSCTQTDSCQSGTCTGGNPVVCTAQDQCHLAGTCDPDTGTCSNPTKADGASCSDGNACTQSDTCQSGSCVGSNPVVCVAQDQCHVVGTCDQQTGACSNPTKPNGSSCSDGDLCTQTDTCQAGACVGGNPKTCHALNQCHDPGVCDPGTGVCSDPAKDDGAPCSDGNACTTTDTCTAGSCTGAFPVVCTALDQCHDAGTCNTQTGVCSNPPKPNGSSCNDDNGCTQTDACQSGSCVGTNPVVCTVQDQCHVLGICNPDTGVCSNPIKPNDSPCNDGDKCTQVDLCESGLCIGTTPVVCTASDQCHAAGACDPNTGICSDPTAPDGKPCNDLDACTQGETCQNGTCADGVPIVCNDNNPCTTDMCEHTSTGGCFVVPDNSASCSDGDACTIGDHCAGGACVPGSVVDTCDDGQVCTADQCNHGTQNNGCFHIDLETPCSDGNACTTGDVCGGGTCHSGTPVECTPLDQCHDVGTCDTQTGLCSNPTKPDGSSCSDGDNCTKPDQCTGGHCAGIPVDCNDHNDCTLDSCDDQGGDFLCKNVDCDTVPGSDCPDHCRTNFCGNGVIEPAAGETCDPPDATLDPVTGQVKCRLDCTSCGDGIVDDGAGGPGHSTHDHGESCDDAKAHSTEDGLCNGLKPVDQCLNTCKGVVCKDPALIKFSAPLHLFKFHGQLVTTDTLDFASEHFVIELQDVLHDVLFRSSLLADSMIAKTSTSFYFKDNEAKVNGGMAKVRIKQARGSYKIYVSTYGDLSLSVADMVTHVYSGTHEWAVRGVWTPITNGWKLSGKSTFLPVP